LRRALEKIEKTLTNQRDKRILSRDQATLSDRSPFITATHLNVDRWPN